MAEWWAARTGISKHPKTYRLAEALGIDDAAGLGYMVALYDFAAAYRERGDLSGLSAREIARGCGWTGDSEAFVAAIRSAGLLDGNLVHDWQESQGPYLRARDRGRERMQQHREKNSTRTVREQYAERSEDRPTDLQTYRPTSKTIGSADAPQENLTRSEARVRWQTLQDRIKQITEAKARGAFVGGRGEDEATLAGLTAEAEKVRQIAYPGT